MGQEPQPDHRHITPVAESDLDVRLRGLAGYWDSKRAGRRFPARADLDPLELKGLLGFLLLVDVVRQDSDSSGQPGGLRFRYRLFGTEFVFYHGSDLTGRWLDEIANSAGRKIARPAGTQATPVMLAKAWRRTNVSCRAT